MAWSEEFFRPLRKDDIEQVFSAYLTDPSSDPAFKMPALGAHYTEVWAAEDAAAAEEPQRELPETRHSTRTRFPSSARGGRGGGGHASHQKHHKNTAGASKSQQAVRRIASPHTLLTPVAFFFHSKTCFRLQHALITPDGDPPLPYANRVSCRGTRFSFWSLLWRIPSLVTCATSATMGRGASRPAREQASPPPPPAVALRFGCWVAPDSRWWRRAPRLAFAQLPALRRRLSSPKPALRQLRRQPHHLLRLVRGPRPPVLLRCGPAPHRARSGGPSSWKPAPPPAANPSSSRRIAGLRRPRAGVKDIPEGSWFCDVCAARNAGRPMPPGGPVCNICCSGKGAMKPAVVKGPMPDGSDPVSEWAHLFCANWTPETFLGSLDTMQPVLGVEGIPIERYRRGAAARARPSPSASPAATSGARVGQSSVARKRALSAAPARSNRTHSPGPNPPLGAGSPATSASSASGRASSARTSSARSRSTRSAPATGRCEWRAPSPRVPSLPDSTLPHRAAPCTHQPPCLVLCERA